MGGSSINGDHKGVQLRREKFAQEFIANGGNATRAAIAAGYSPHSATVTGSQLLANPIVIGAVRTAAEQAIEKSGLSAELVLTRLRQAVDLDPRRLFRPDGSLKSVHELDDDTAYAVQSMEHDQLTTGRGPNRRVLGTTSKLRFVDRVSAMEKALRVLGMFERDNRQRLPSMALQINVAGGLAVEEPEDP